ncbi:metallophosphatase domain-containing protein [Limibacter armeniacum]|uniref:metallophosphatase domain-containing protein n=1 Tax=Limibacter armeniacum TaxID=466084 RepID=UPI002FE54E96
MRFVAISDTHGKHNQLQLPAGDVLIHAGDISYRGKQKEVEKFLRWFTAQPHSYKIFIAGNHDFFFEQEDNKTIASIIPDNIIYLNDSGCQIDGINIWGSPIQPRFNNWAFNRDRGEDIAKHWKLIPEDTDLLITHGPPKGILDKTFLGLRVGCEELRTRVEQVKPKVHVSGHIHENYGSVSHQETLFLNASSVNLFMKIVNEPLVFEI